MRTFKINDEAKKVNYKANVGISLKSTHDSFAAALYSADIYELEDMDGRVIVATRSNGTEIRKTAKYISLSLIHI